MTPVTTRRGLIRSLYSSLPGSPSCCGQDKEGTEPQIVPDPHPKTTQEKPVGVHKGRGYKPPKNETGRLFWRKRENNQRDNKPNVGKGTGDPHYRPNRFGPETLVRPDVAQGNSESVPPRPILPIFRKEPASHEHEGSNDEEGFHEGHPTEAEASSQKGADEAATRDGTARAGVEALPRTQWW